MDDDGPVRVVTILRAERRNAVDGKTAQALAAAFRDFEADDAAAVAILTGEGDHFCAGADLKALSADAGAANVLDDDMSADGPMGPTRKMGMLMMTVLYDGDDDDDDGGGDGDGDDDDDGMLMVMVMVMVMVMGMMMNVR